MLPLSVLRNETSAPSVSARGLTEIVRDESSQRLIAAMGKLSARQRDVLHLVFYQDLTIAAAAEVLGISVGSARVHYDRGKKQLRELLDSDDHEQR